MKSCALSFVMPFGVRIDDCAIQHQVPCFPERCFLFLHEVLGEMNESHPVIQEALEEKFEPGERSALSIAPGIGDVESAPAKFNCESTELALDEIDGIIDGASGSDEVVIRPGAVSESSETVN